MALSINTNMASLNAQRNLDKTQNRLNTSLQRLSSGLRINSAKDDATGMAMANRMTAQIRGLNQAVRNSNDGISLAQTAEGALQETVENLMRLRELGNSLSGDLPTADDRASAQVEIDQLVAEINRIAENTTFNNRKILNGSSDSFNFQVGANANETINLDLVNVKANALGSQAGITQSTGSRVSLLNGATDVGNIGIQEGAATTAVIATEFKIEIAGTSSVDIAAAGYGGSISSTVTASLQDVNNADYGGGIAKDIAERINFIRELNETDTTYEDKTTLENVYASAKTSFKAADMVALDYGGSAVASDEYTYVGAGSITNGQLEINGVDIGAVAFKEKDADSSLTDAINAKSDLTGVTASINNDGELLLSAEDGRDIVVTTTSDVAGTTTNLLFGAAGAGTTDFDADFASLRITGAVTITAMDTIAGTATTDAGFTTLTEDNVQATGSIANADVSTAAGANILVESVDSALKQVDNMRVKLGAVQNRFASTISNLQNVSENLSASRSRIMDTDFASETAVFTKTQIMQQAGVAMLAQAKQLQQGALSLLQ